jgi:hypothetical protein
VDFAPAKNPMDSMIVNGRQTRVPKQSPQRWQRSRPHVNSNSDKQNLLLKSFSPPLAYDRNAKTPAGVGLPGL